ncbi:hypothetical protein NKG94_50550 [Micromonospora sp. M12]
MTFAWNASTDNVGVAFYDIYHDGQQMKTVSGSTLSTSLTVVRAPPGACTSTRGTPPATSRRPAPPCRSPRRSARSTRRRRPHRSSSPVRRRAPPSR